jgi:hypothetical protein
MLQTTTHMIPTHQVSLVKLSNNGSSNEPVTGFEYVPPIVGQPYRIYIGDRKNFKTSPVEDIKEAHNGMLIRTKNSIYRIKYLGAYFDSF